MNLAFQVKYYLFAWCDVEDYLSMPVDMGRGGVVTVCFSVL